MTEQETNDAFDVYEKLYFEINYIISDNVAGLNEEQEAYVMERIKHQFEFFKSKKD